ncbi:DUF2726 domain-containing protein [Terasakiella sp. SH-1]|uniref:DUF2726 domain-containing protein n=1 Tax=Terasakiella sp. SH-1 TaxID=2560057 RepID=UPI001073722A|nr:DUF2726 domain-containing protein [Terasakiella sp. SH-1]
MYDIIGYLLTLVMLVLFLRELAKKKKRNHFQQYDLSDPNNQLRFVSNASFKSKPLMERKVAHVFYDIENKLKARDLGERVFSEVALGAYLNTVQRDDNAFKSINSKRCDFLIINRYGQPICAVEYQGKEHYQGTARHRDAIKAIAHEKAGVAFLELFPEDSKDIIHAKLERALAA